MLDGEVRKLLERHQVLGNDQDMCTVSVFFLPCEVYHVAITLTYNSQMLNVLFFYEPQTANKSMGFNELFF